MGCDNKSWTILIFSFSIARARGDLLIYDIISLEKNCKFYEIVKLEMLLTKKIKI